MCDPNVDSSIVIGPGDVLGEIAESWESLRTVDRFGLYDRPLLSNLRFLGGHWGADAPAILQVAHPRVPGHIVADELTVELALLRGQPVMCEPSYGVGIASDGWQGRESDERLWDIELDDEAVQRAASQLSPDSGDGRRKRVGVIDSGATGSFMLEMVTDALPHTARGEDEIGHGTAINSLIMALRPDAEIHPIRVLARNPGESKHLLLGLICALWPDEEGNARYDAVNVSLTRQLIDSCSTSIGRSMRFTQALCARKGTVPPVIAAVGNRTQNQQFGYPAALPDALAAVALTWDGATADYNVIAPEGTVTRFRVWRDSRDALRADSLERSGYRSLRKLVRRGSRNLRSPLQQLIRLPATQDLRDRPIMVMS